MPLAITFPHPIVAVGTSLQIPVQGASGVVTFSNYNSAAVSLSSTSTNGNTTQISLAVGSAAYAPQVYSYTITDQSTPNPQMLTANVLVVPASYANGKNVFFYGVDGTVYLLAQLRGQAPTLTALGGVPVLVNDQQGSATEVPYRLKSQKLVGTDPANYVTCYLLKFNDLDNG